MGTALRKYLKENHKVLYYNYLTSGTLYKHISEVEKQAENLFASVVKLLSKKEGVTEKIKAESPTTAVSDTESTTKIASETVPPSDTEPPEIEV